MNETGQRCPAFLSDNAVRALRQRVNWFSGCLGMPTMVIGSLKTLFPHFVPPRTPPFLRFNKISALFCNAISNRSPFRVLSALLKTT